MAHDRRNGQHPKRPLLAVASGLSVIASGLTVVLSIVVLLGVPEGIIDSDASAGHARVHHHSVPRHHVSRAAREVRAAVFVSSAPQRGVPPIRPGFVGISLELTAVRSYAGPGLHHLNRLFEQLVRKLAPGQRPILRIGGDSTDRTWWPVAGIARSPGLRNRLTRAWLTRTRTLLSDLHARAIVGVNLEAGVPGLAIDEGRALIAGLGRNRIQAIEIGNEPSNYSRYAWYRVRRRRVFGRGPGYGFSAFLQQFDAVRRHLPGVPLAGPTLGGDGWLTHLPAFLADEPAVTTVTLHRYPLHRCFAVLGSRDTATLPNLLAPTASSDFFAPLRAATWLAHVHHAALRLDELNSVSCGGKRGLSDRFVSALWALDALFEVAKAGVDGVNIHTFPGAAYRLFDFRRRGAQWSATVRPEYYGLLMFARAVPPGSWLLGTNSAASPKLKAWATRSRAGTVRVVLINKSLRERIRALVRIRGLAEAGRLERLTAPSALAKDGITLAGQHFPQNSHAALLAGPPRISLVRPHGGVYGITLSPASAALLTLPKP
jgi:hypothetical protein